MKKAQLMMILMLALVCSGIAGAVPVQLTQPEFKTGDESAKPMVDMLKSMSDELQVDLACREDIQIVDKEKTNAAKLTCIVQNMKSVTTVFNGSTYKAWNTRVAVNVQMQFQTGAGKPQKCAFTIVKRLRSTSGEPQVDKALCQTLAREIVNQCYEELVNMVQEQK